MSICLFIYCFCVYVCLSVCPSVHSSVYSAISFIHTLINPSTHVYFRHQIHEKVKNVAHSNIYICTCICYLHFPLFASAFYSWHFILKIRKILWFVNILFETFGFVTKLSVTGYLRKLTCLRWLYLAYATIMSISIFCKHPTLRSAVYNMIRYDTIR